MRWSLNWRGDGLTRMRCSASVGVRDLGNVRHQPIGRHVCIHWPLLVKPIFFQVLNDIIRKLALHRSGILLGRIASAALLDPRELSSISTTTLDGGREVPVGFRSEYCGQLDPSQDIEHVTNF